MKILKKFLNFVFILYLRINIIIIGFFVKTNLRLFFTCIFSAFTFQLGFVYPLFFGFQIFFWELFLFSLWFYLCMKNEIIKEYAYTHLDKDFVIKNVGNLGKHGFKIIAPVLGAVTLHIAGVYIAHSIVNPQAVEVAAAMQELSREQITIARKSVYMAEQVHAAAQEKVFSLSSNPDTIRAVELACQDLDNARQRLSEVDKPIAVDLYKKGESIFTKPILDFCNGLKDTEFTVKGKWSSPDLDSVKVDKPGK